MPVAAAVAVADVGVNQDDLDEVAVRLDSLRRQTPSGSGVRGSHAAEAV